MDIFTKEKRSDIMSRIRSAGNRGTELKLMGLMRECGIGGWRRGSKLPGHPDFVFSRAALVVFVDGCFWHGCPLHCRLPTSRKKFWLGKIERNMQRDREVTRELKALGWCVMRIWEHSLRKPLASRTIARLLRNLGENAVMVEPKVKEKKKRKKKPAAKKKTKAKTATKPATKKKAVKKAEKQVYPEVESGDLMAAED